MKTRLLLLVMVALLVIAGLAGCGSKKGGETQTPPSTSSPTGTVTPSGTATPSGTTTPSAGGSAWPDIPLYPGLRQVQRVSQSLPQTQGYVKAEFRVYETNDSLEKVVAFYKSQMPAKGWEEILGTATNPQFSMGGYTKNNETDIAWVWVFSVEGKTEVMLGRATK